MNTMRHYREIIAYVFFGVLAVLLNCILYILFNHFWVYEFANGIGNALANFICIIFAYVTNRIAVFCNLNVCYWSLSSAFKISIIKL